MKKKQTTVRSSSVVRAKKSGQCDKCAGIGELLYKDGHYPCPKCKGTGRRGSGLPGAAQRARSRQRGATLIAELGQLAHDRDATPAHCAMVSGGIGSYIALKRVVEQHGTTGVVGLFANVRMEDEDTYRFLTEAMGFLGVPLHIVQDGRNVWDVFYDGHCIGNSKVDLCSSTLKRDLQDKWRDARCDPERTTIYVGIDWTEKHRLDNARAYMAKQAAEGKPHWRYEAPLVSPPYKTKLELLDANAERMESSRRDSTRWASRTTTVAASA